MSTVWIPRWLSGKEFACQCRRCRRRSFDPWVRKISWSRKWQPTLVSFPGKFYGQGGLACYSSWGRKESDTTKWLNWTELNMYSWALELPSLFLLVTFIFITHCPFYLGFQIYLDGSVQSNLLFQFKFLRFDGYFSLFLSYLTYMVFLYHFFLKLGGG